MDRTLSELPHLRVTRRECLQSELSKTFQVVIRELARFRQNSLQILLINTRLMFMLHSKRWLCHPGPNRLTWQETATPSRCNSRITTLNTRMLWCEKLDKSSSWWKLFKVHLKLQAKRNRSSIRVSMAKSTASIYLLQPRQLLQS